MRSAQKQRAIRLRIVVCVAGAALSLAGCGAGTGAASEPPVVPDSPSSSPPPQSTDPAIPSTPGTGLPEGPIGTATAEPGMAVPAPGKLTDRLRSADLLVFSAEPIPDAVRRSVEALDGVTAVEPLSLSQVSIENRVVNVAAVDPESFRRFTSVEVAQNAGVWERIAGGEASIQQGLARKLMDDAGSLKLGAGTDAPTVHVGAYAAQIPQIDAVVNARWGDALKMRSGNALLISTDLADPAVVRPKVVKAVGRKASVQRLDIAARLGLDTSGIQTAVLTGGAVADAVGAFNYTVLGGGRIAPEQSWVDKHIATETVPILGTVTCNAAMLPQLRAALAEVVNSGLADEIDPAEYAGCYYPRFIAGSTTLSNHSFGLALDINTPGNLRGTVGEIDRRVVAIFKNWGFAWGGDWSYTDPMHFEMNRVVAPG